LLKVIREGNGLSRGEILGKMGSKGGQIRRDVSIERPDRADQSHQVSRRDGKYVIA